MINNINQNQRLFKQINSIYQANKNKMNFINKLQNGFRTFSIFKSNHYFCSNASQKVRVRYAPSPTGFMHLGGLRTALFNYLFAKKNKGQFIIRIEDTDKARQVEGSIQNIFQTLEWIQIVADQSIKTQKQPFGPYIQSERMEQYKNIQKLFLKNNLAYPCFCSYQNKNTPAKKKQQKQIQHHQPQDNFYPGTCRNLSFQEVKSKIKNGQKYAVRIKSNLFQHPQYFYDQNYGKIAFTKFDDFVIVKQDGWPTFHFANVIDDWKMNITHVMRGQQWLSNTSKHIYLYKILNASTPKFIHLPLIKNSAGKKLAKRDPGSSLLDIMQNYQPKAIKNYVLRLGWTPQYIKQKQNKDQESIKNSTKKQEAHIQLWSQDQMIQKFNLQNIMKNPAKFDVKTMNFYNRKCLKEMWRHYQKLQKQLLKPNIQQKQSRNKKQQIQKIFKYFRQKLQKQIPQAKQSNPQVIQLIWSILYQRINKNEDLKEYSYFFKNQPIKYEKQQYKKDLKGLFGLEAKIQNNKILADLKLIQKNLKILHNVRLILEHIISPQDYNEENISKKFSQFLYQNRQIENQQFFHLIRFVMTGHKSGPTTSRSMIIFGRQRVLKSLQSFYQMLKP